MNSSVGIQRLGKVLTPGRLALLLSLIAFLMGAWIGTGFPFDTSDGYDFLVEARSQNAHSWQVNWERPRALVFLLTAYDQLFELVYGHLPSMAAVHILNAVIGGLFVLVWYLALRKFFSEWVSLAACALLVILPDYISNAYLCMADLLAGLIFGLVAWVLSFKTMRTSLGGVALLGVLSALMALSKNQEFAFPVVIFGLIFWYEKENRKISTLVSFGLGYAFTVEILHRAVASPRTGLFSYLQYLVGKIFWAFKVEELTSKLVYWDRLSETLGLPLLFLLLFAILVLTPYLFLSRNHRTFVKSPGLFVGILLTALFFVALNQKIPNREPRYLLPFYPPLFAVGLGAIIHCVGGLSKVPRTVLTILILALFVTPVYQLTKSATVLNRIASDRALRADVEHLWAVLRGDTDGIKCDRVLTSSDWGYDRAAGAYRLNLETRPQFTYQPGSLSSSEVLKAALLKELGPAPGKRTCLVLREMHWGDRDSLALTVEKILESDKNPLLGRELLFQGRKKDF